MKPPNPKKNQRWRCQLAQRPARLAFHSQNPQPQAVRRSRTSWMRIKTTALRLTAERRSASRRSHRPVEGTTDRGEVVGSSPEPDKFTLAGAMHRRETLPSLRLARAAPRSTMER